MSLVEKKEIEEIVKRILYERNDIKFIPALCKPIAEAIFEAGYRKKIIKITVPKLSRKQLELEMERQFHPEVEIVPDIIDVFAFKKQVVEEFVDCFLKRIELNSDGMVDNKNYLSHESIRDILSDVASFYDVVLGEKQ